MNIAEHKAKQASLVTEFNTANKPMTAVEFTDRMTGEIFHGHTIDKAYQGSSTQGFTAFVKVECEGNVSDAPLALVTVTAKEPQTLKANEAVEQESIADQRQVAAPEEKPVDIEALGLKKGSEIKQTVTTKPVKKPKATPEIEQRETLTVKEKKPALELVEPPIASIGEGDSKHVVMLSVKNIMGISEIEVPLNGQATVIEGRNGQGKSSIIRSLLTGLGGGYPAELVRNGEDGGEIVMVLNDSMEIKKRIKTDKNGSTTVKKNGKSVSKPQTVLNSLFDPVAIDPARFLSSNAQQQVEMMLESTPMILSDDNKKLAEQLGVDTDVHPLKVLDKVEKQLKRINTDLNSRIKQQQASTDRLKSALPKVDVESCSTLEEAIEKKQTDLSEIDSKMDEKLDLINSKRKIGRQTIRDEFKEEMDAAQNRALDIKAEIIKLESELHKVEETIQSSSSKLNIKLEDYDKQVSQKIDETRNAAAIDRLHINNDLDGLRRTLANFSTYQNTLKSIKDSEGEITDLEAKKAENDSLVALAKQQKSSLITNIPIKGIEVTEEGILCDGVIFKMLNTAKKAEIAINIAVMRLDANPDQVRLVIVDGAECMDSSTLHAVIDAAKAQKVQLVIAKTTDSDLNITQIAS